MTLHEDEASLTACCRAFRLGRQAEASVLLDTLLATLAAHLDTLPAARASTLQPSLMRAMDCQARHDSIALADELEFVLWPALQSAGNPDGAGPADE